MCLVDRGRPGPKNTLPSPLPLPLPRPLPLPLALPHTPTPTPHPYYPSPTHTLTPTRTDTPSFRSLGVGPLVGPPTKRTKTMFVVRFGVWGLARSLDHQQNVQKQCLLYVSGFGGLARSLAHQQKARVRDLRIMIGRA